MGCGASADAHTRSSRHVYTVQPAAGAYDDLASNPDGDADDGDPLRPPNDDGRGGLRTADADRTGMCAAEAAHWRSFAEHHSDAASGGIVADEPGDFSLSVSRAAVLAVARVRHGIDGDPDQYDADPVPPVTVHESKKRVTAWLSEQRRCSIRSSATASWVSIPSGASPPETHRRMDDGAQLEGTADDNTARHTRRADEAPYDPAAEARKFRERSISTTSATLLPGGLVGVPAIGTTQLLGHSSTDRDRSAIFAFSMDSAGAVNDRSTSIVDGAALLASLAETEKRANSGGGITAGPHSASGSGAAASAAVQAAAPGSATASSEPPRLTEAVLYLLQEQLTA